MCWPAGPLPNVNTKLQVLIQLKSKEDTNDDGCKSRGGQRLKGARSHPYQKAESKAPQDDQSDVACSQPPEWGSQESGPRCSVARHPIIQK